MRQHFDGCIELEQLPVNLLEEGARVVVPERAYEFPQAKPSLATELVLPETVARIDPWPFAGCSSLERVETPGVLRVGDGTFSGCCSLRAVDAKMGVRTARLAFERILVSGDAREIPGGVPRVFFADSHPRVVGSGAFQGCRLSQIQLPTSVRCIGPRLVNQDVASLDRLAARRLLGEDDPAAEMNMDSLTPSEPDDLISEASRRGCGAAAGVLLDRRGELHGRLDPARDIRPRGGPAQDPGKEDMGAKAGATCAGT